MAKVKTPACQAGASVVKASTLDLQDSAACGIIKTSTLRSGFDGGSRLPTEQSRACRRGLAVAEVELVAHPEPSDRGDHVVLLHVVGELTPTTIHARGYEEAFSVAIALATAHSCWLTLNVGRKPQGRQS